MTSATKNTAAGFRASWATWLLDPRRRGLHIAFIAVALVVHTATHYATFIPVLREPLADLPYFRLHVLHEAEFLLIVAYAGVVLGLRGGLVATLITAVTSVPFILMPYVFGRDPRPGEIRDLVIQVVFVLLMGLAITLLYDRDKRRRDAEGHSERLRDLDRTRSNFLSMAAHELRSPMTSVAGFSELLLKRDTSLEQQRDWLRVINEESRRMTGLLEELLDVSQMERGKLEFRDEELDLPQAVKEALDSLGEPLVGHRIVVDVPNGLPPARGDQGKLVQMLVNLMSNAVKYSPSGGEVRVAASPLADGTVRIAVSDQGMGVPESARERLFSPFYRVESDGTKRIPGTGLGLYIVKSLVETMGGNVSLDSVVGQGSTFSLTLPAWSGDGEASMDAGLAA